MEYPKRSSDKFFLDFYGNLVTQISSGAARRRISESARYWIREFLSGGAPQQSGIWRKAGPKTSGDGGENCSRDSLHLEKDRSSHKQFQGKDRKRAQGERIMFLVSGYYGLEASNYISDLFSAYELPHRILDWAPSRGGWWSMVVGLCDQGAHGL
ncbi:uncharacterized protein LACBIDRAFT_330075 [Laccaria bicolor S238N-H82]|uniref:Predicted protein n=1 Tax=Laccaria bicolor (strain S238N-H82 / ATCC MYA-4686) TaxID=486041 RepID=B0DK68_LACBS|nr:uncharacterized protein LACBIDRAFT_330075 [Laccaria bicolor S238N-H82]EDR05016.1 predicted protein [Laccaria bicolor S238N-H82]|eukprot:XP_001884406.1 predicted protein [Laccaria bicolor S238N-H82]